MSDAHKILEKYIKEYDPSRTYEPAITLEDIPHEIDYNLSRSILPKDGIHLGQRKLGLSEIQFLTEHPCKYVVYAGSSPSHKIYYLSQLFPDTRFVLIDPRKPRIFVDEKHTVHDPDNNDIPKNIRDRFSPLDINASEDELVSVITDPASPVRIFMIKGYFSDDLARKLAPIRANFISDIRSITEGAESGPQDLDVLWNLSQQYNWMRIMRPTHSCVKFRQVFYTPSGMKYFLKHHNDSFYSRSFRTSKSHGIDFIQDYKNKVMVYPHGKVYLQAWMGSSSTETRLHIRGEDLERLHDYDITSYENKLQFYNSFYRTYVNHINVNADSSICFGHCNDCAIESHIWERYIKTILGKKPTPSLVRKHVKELSSYSSELCTGWHNTETEDKDTYARMDKEIKRRVEVRRGGYEIGSRTLGIIVAFIVVIIALLVIITLIPTSVGNTPENTDTRAYT